MKQILSLILSLAVAVGAAAADRLYIENFDIAPGATKTVEVMLDNSTTFAAMQCDLALPSGLSVTQVAKATRCRNHTLTTQAQSDGSLRVWISSMTSRAISGTSGVLFTVTVQATEGFGSNQQLWLRNIVGGHETADAAGERIELPDAVCYINGAGVRGDVNGDGKVDVDDLNIVINIMLGKSTMTKWPAADIDASGNVDVDDLNIVINIMLGKERG